MELIDYAVTKGMENDRKQAEHYLLNYEAECAVYENEKHDALYGSPWVESVGKSNLPGKPTETQAITSAQYDMDSTVYPWLKAVDMALRSFGERKRIFITVRKEAEALGREGKPMKGRRGWVVYTQRRYSEEIQRRFINDDGWLGERTIKAWWRQVLDCVVMMYLRYELEKNKKGQHFN